MCSPSRLIGRSKCTKRTFEGYEKDYYFAEDFYDSEEDYITTEYYGTTDNYGSPVYCMDKIRESQVTSCKRKLD